MYFSERIDSRLLGKLFQEVVFLLISYVRTVVLYLVLIAVIRLLGKRQIGQLEPSELVVAMLVADLASIPMQDSAIPLLSGLVPILTVLGLELVLSMLSMRSIRLRRLLCGTPVILIDNGKLLEKNLRKTRITLDELTEQLRQKDILDLDSVQFAILETGGQLSVFPYPETIPASAQDAGVAVQKQYLPITVISDGCVLEDNLRRSGKDMQWLQRQLRKQKAAVQQTLLLTVDGSNRVVFRRKEG